MDDASLNRAVAAARGKKIETIGRIDWIDEGGGYMLAVPNICTDPAAWGGLYTWLASEGYGVDILYSTFHHEHIATVWNKQREPFSVGGSSPGRALALAFLTSKGVKL